MSPECADTRIVLAAPRTSRLQLEMLMAADIPCLQGGTVQPPPSADSQHYELCCLACTAGTKPQPGHVPSSSPCLFQHSSPVRISIQAFPSSCAWGHPGMLTLPTESSLHGKSPTLAHGSENTFPSCRPASRERSPQSSEEATLGNEDMLCLNYTESVFPASPTGGWENKDVQPVRQ